ncbi:hypothetical protein D3C71_1085200 [compost metagenome]
MERQFDDVFAALFEIRMGEFEEGGHDVQVGDAQCGEVAVRVEFGSDQHVGADHFADAGEKISLGIVITLRRHRAMQAENHAIDWQGGFQFGKDLVAQRLVGLALDEARGLSPAGRAFDDGEAFFPAAAAQDRDDGGAQGRRIGMFARSGIKRRLEGVHIRRHGRKSVRFGRQRGGEDAHVLLSEYTSASGRR